MSDSLDKTKIVSYKFHHIDINKCKRCEAYWCDDACFRGIYEVLKKDSEPMCVVVEEGEDNCVKCHICTTACKLRAITID